MQRKPRTLLHVLVLPVREACRLRHREHRLVRAPHHWQHVHLAGLRRRVPMLAVKQFPIDLAKPGLRALRHSRPHVEPHRRPYDKLLRLGAMRVRVQRAVVSSVEQHRLHPAYRDVQKIVPRPVAASEEEAGHDMQARHGVALSVRVSPA